MHHRTAIFQRPETTPPMPAYHTSPKTIEKRIVWQTERVMRAGRSSALVTIMFYGSTPAICRTSASALNNPSPVCVAMCAPERRPCAHRDANLAICVAMCAHLSFRRALRDANHSPRTRRAPYIGNSPPITRLHSKQPGEPTHGALPCVSSPGCQPHQSSERNELTDARDRKAWRTTAYDGTSSTPQRNGRSINR